MANGFLSISHSVQRDPGPAQVRADELPLLGRVEGRGRRRGRRDQAELAKTRIQVRERCTAIYGKQSFFSKKI